MELLDGKKLKLEILDELKKEVELIDIKPTLCVIQIGDDEASNIYINQKRKMCDYIGYNFIHKKFDCEKNEEEIIEEIEKLNNDDNVDAILIQMPIPTKLNPKTLQNKVLPIKDVDGLNDTNIMNLINKKDGLFPCTACGVIELLKRYQIPIEGMDIVIVGRSFLVGTPLFFMLENQNATVTLCHSKTKNLKDKIKNADILICAVGKKHLITSDMIKENAVIVDVGINKEDNKLYGDVDFDNCIKKASYISPVPGGVGPTTIAFLAKNILKAYKMRRKNY